MINPPDELLADLQSALPPESDPTSPHQSTHHHHHHHHHHGHHGHHGHAPMPNGASHLRYDTIQDAAQPPHHYDSADYNVGGGVANYEPSYSVPDEDDDPQVEGGREREGGGKKEGEKEGERGS